MKNSMPKPETRAWRSLYNAALFEVDGSKLPERIAQAEAALVLRARELFYAAGDNIEEEEALDDAMYALRALRNTYQCPRAGVESNRVAA
ncbi:MAG: hypothetical protein WCB53_15945 [Terriglobales bacterium]|jgi:hypothetical protein